jgi:hypothetical protein
MDRTITQSGTGVPASPGGEPVTYAMPGACPVCGGELAVTRLECGHCGTAVVGRYRASRFARLTPDQLTFLEAFLCSRGNIRKVERELGISYPTVRSRLSALLTALGFAVEVEEDDETVQRRRKEILDQLEVGTLAPEEAARRLRQLTR